MNRYLMIRRLWWPVMLVLTGVLALLHQMDVVRFSHTWPLYLIFWGALLLAERATVNEAGLPPYVDPMGGPYAGPMATAGPVGGVAPVQTVQTSVVPAHVDEIRHRGTNGGGEL
ncbi:LiaF transmembrane domain-containing protein [Terracidiphilus gabretensis]|jgi:Domain of unknown function (DUF5668)|uniref:LiaF transmembrane domain-containing protein n=1 Tax=Terracidiphilus gabretensis TaxID=1577687 RepID=UPI00071B4B56|nr:DUF5668 domain-containing protein [Terracidiphilus gabretensis]